MTDLDPECSYVRQPFDWETFSGQAYNWGEWPGVDGPVLLCVVHGWPGWGEVYDRLDDDSTAGVPCQSMPMPESIR